MNCNRNYRDRLPSRSTGALLCQEKKSNPDYSSMAQIQPMMQPMGQPMMQPMGQPMMQPMMQPMAQPTAQPAEEEWGTALFDCFEDVSTCCYGWWCAPCLACTVSGRLKECYFLPICDYFNVVPPQHLA
ncbi:hypothetical protein WMY93_024560 [Mugilogobius chulae]|uniref:Uncharacterized protein n=1 Tax=Mugilogobius chulae TaxID=88201 RepID=A0AAW0MZY5_9GOBI